MSREAGILNVEPTRYIRMYALCCASTEYVPGVFLLHYTEVLAVFYLHIYTGLLHCISNRRSDAAFLAVAIPPAGLVLVMPLLLLLLLLLLLPTCCFSHASKYADR